MRSRSLPPLQIRLQQGEQLSATKAEHLLSWPVPITISDVCDASGTSGSQHLRLGTTVPAGIAGG